MGQPKQRLHRVARNVYTFNVARVSPTINLYALLGVDREASPLEIENAHRRLARAHRPENSPGKTSRQYLKLLNFAYRCLVNPTTRKLYDEFGNESLRQDFRSEASRNARHSGSYDEATGARSYRWQSEAARAANGPPSSAAPSFGWINDVAPPSSATRPSFRWLGDWSKPPSSQSPGSFSWLGEQTANNGFDAPSSLGWLSAPTTGPPNSQRLGPAAKKSRPKTARRKKLRTQVSRGTKARVNKSKVPRGPDVTTTVSLSFKQAVRGGTIQIPSTRDPGTEISVETPPGIASGDTLKVKGQGGESRHGGETGDLLLAITVRSHRSFVRKGDDLHVDLPVSLKEAALGARMIVPTPHGKVNLKIFPGTQTGKTLRLRGRGVHRPNVPAGDMYVRVMVIYPNDQAMGKLLASLPEQKGIRANWP